MEEGTRLRYWESRYGDVRLLVLREDGFMCWLDTTRREDRAYAVSFVKSRTRYTAREIYGSCMDLGFRGGVIRDPAEDLRGVIWHGRL